MSDLKLETHKDALRIQADNSRLTGLLEAARANNASIYNALQAAYTPTTAQVGLVVSKGNVQYSITPASNDFSYVRSRAAGEYKTMTRKKYVETPLGIFLQKSIH